MLNRRTLLATAGAGLAFAAAPALALASRDAELAARLDEIDAGLKAKSLAPAAALSRLEAFDPAGLSPARRREYEAVRQGLRTEAQIAASGRNYELALQLAYGAPIHPKAANLQAMAAAEASQARADVLLKAHGLRSGSVSERIGELFKDERYLYSDSDAGRARAVADMNGWLAAIRPKLPRAFGDLPVAAAEVRRISPGDEAKARPGYREVGKDGAPGAYYVDLHDIRSRPRWTLRSVVHHELIPGHLLQLPLEAKAAPHPLRVRYSQAYTEAWGVYAEQLAFDLGAFAADPLSEIGYLHWRLFRLARVVADTGMGVLGWSADRAAHAMTTLQGPPIAFITIEQDVGRMQKSPGQEAAQGIAALALASWRPASHAAWPGYHKAVLADGPWPFGVLKEIVKR